MIIFLEQCCGRSSGVSSQRAELGEAEVLRRADAGAGRGVVVIAVQVQQRGRGRVQEALVRVVVVVRLQVGAVRGGEHGVGRVRRRLMLALEGRATQDELRAVGLRAA